MDSINIIFKVIKHMNTHIEEKLSLDDLCVVSGYTKSHLCHLFKFYIGETPNKYFYQQKLKYAADILSGDENVVDVAVRIGFSSHEAFSRAFKKEFGITPIRYRELYDKDLSKLSELSDIELIVLFEPSPAYRRDYLGLDLYGKYQDIYQSLIKKGFISETYLELVVDGVAQRDKYYWDCSKIIIELSRTYDTLAELYENTIKLVYMPKLLFFRFLYGLIEMKKVKNIFIGCCGSDCFKCDTLKASIKDDDDLRKEIAERSKIELPYELNYSEVNCFGCTSDDVSENCISHCTWKPCCKSHGVNRCNQCVDYPCNELAEMYKHLPEFKLNFLKGE